MQYTRRGEGKGSRPIYLSQWVHFSDICNCLWQFTSPLNMIYNLFGFPQVTRGLCRNEANTRLILLVDRKDRLMHLEKTQTQKGLSFTSLLLQITDSPINKTPDVQNRDATIYSFITGQSNPIKLLTRRLIFWLLQSSGQQPRPWFSICFYIKVILVLLGILSCLQRDRSALL